LSLAWSPMMAATACSLFTIATSLAKCALPPLKPPPLLGLSAGRQDQFGRREAAPAVAGSCEILLAAGRGQPAPSGAAALRGAPRTRIAAGA
jgi:hypothetical protein